jgi:hypothetical protein
MMDIADNVFSEHVRLEAYLYGLDEEEYSRWRGYAFAVLEIPVTEHSRATRALDLTRNEAVVRYLGVMRKVLYGTFVMEA